MKRIILASQSPRRKELLNQIGIECDCIPSDEDEVINDSNPDDIVISLSYQKAKNVADKNEGNYDVVIGADTIVYCNGQILGKPKDRTDAKRMISLLQGNVHQVYTGVTLIMQDKIERFSECTNVYVNSMSETEIDKYIAIGEPDDKAGAYGIQGIFAAFISKIEGDYNNVVGLPVSAIYERIQHLL